MKYKIFAALYEESTSGWVWLANPRVEPHRLISLRSQEIESHPIIYCEARSLDDNFVTYYNSKAHTKKINQCDYQDVLIISDWYRRALSIPQTQTQVDLYVRDQERPFLPALRAGSQHPDPTVRLANRLGLISTWLGLLGIAAAVDPFIKAIKEAAVGDDGALYSSTGWLLFILVISAACFWGLRGVRRPK